MYNNNIIFYRIFMITLLYTINMYYILFLIYYNYYITLNSLNFKTLFYKKKLKIKFI